MRKIKSYFFVSLDGVVESPDKWHFPYFDDEMGAAVSAGFATADALRVNLADKHAMCMHCAQHWDSTDGSIVLLADYIRATDQVEARVWKAGCDHSWRLTVVSPLGISGRCAVCHAMETRRTWPAGTATWTELDEQMRGASA